ncbi:MAG: hypothetical protein ABFD62_04610 [Syntrophaceae bacterium]
MSSIGGRLAKVVYNGNTIAGLGTWSMSGFVPDIQEDTAFGDTVKKWKRAGIDDAGEVSFSGNYDPDDTNGQVALNALSTVDGGVTLLYFYETTTMFWRVAAGGEIVLTKFNAVTMSKNALGTVEFTGKISGKAMERVGT